MRGAGSLKTDFHEQARTNPGTMNSGNLSSEHGEREGKAPSRQSGVEGATRAPIDRQGGTEWKQEFLS